MNLVDTDVLVDCLRGTIAAQAWLEQLAEQPSAVPAVAAMELVMGCKHFQVVPGLDVARPYSRG